MCLKYRGITEDEGGPVVSGHYYAPDFRYGFTQNFTTTTEGNFKTACKEYAIKALEPDAIGDILNIFSLKSFFKPVDNVLHQGAVSVTQF